jgi:uncharacterized membrane protein
LNDVLPLPILVLAAGGTGVFPTGAYIWIVIAAIFVLMLGGFVVLQLRKKMLEGEDGKNASASLMETLRSMHARGEISDAEYEQTRKSIASRVSVMLDTKRSDGLFELPEPKRRLSRPDAPGPGPIAPAPDRTSPNPPPPPAKPPTDMPPGYDDEGKPRWGTAQSGDRP